MRWSIPRMFQNCICIYSSNKSVDSLMLHAVSRLGLHSWFRPITKFALIAREIWYWLRHIKLPVVSILFLYYAFYWPVWISIIYADHCDQKVQHELYDPNLIKKMKTHVSKTAVKCNIYILLPGITVLWEPWATLSLIFISVTDHYLPASFSDIISHTINFYTWYLQHHFCIRGDLYCFTLTILRIGSEECLTRLPELETILWRPVVWVISYSSQSN
jgi:hypothetical protein